MYAYSNKSKSRKMRIKVTEQTQCEFKMNPFQLHTHSLSEVLISSVFPNKLPSPKSQTKGFPQ